jgi:hypothetical protein
MAPYFRPPGRVLDVSRTTLTFSPLTFLYNEETREDYGPSDKKKVCGGCYAHNELVSEHFIFALILALGLNFFQGFTIYK